MFHRLSLPRLRAFHNGTGHEEEHLLHCAPLEVPKAGQVLCSPQTRGLVHVAVPFVHAQTRNLRNHTHEARQSRAGHASATRLNAHDKSTVHAFIPQALSPARAALAHALYQANVSSTVDLLCSLRGRTKVGTANLEEHTPRASRRGVIFASVGAWLYEVLLKWSPRPQNHSSLLLWERRKLLPSSCCRPQTWKPQIRRIMHTCHHPLRCWT